MTDWPTLDELAAEEAELQFSGFSEDDRGHERGTGARPDRPAHEAIL